MSAGKVIKNPCFVECKRSSQKRAISKVDAGKVIGNPSVRCSQQQDNMKVGHASNMAKGIKSATEPTVQVADMECKNEYRPTVRVNCNLNCVVNEQKGYKGTYIPPTLQVLISQEFLRGLAEVGFVWNLFGLVHCVVLYVFKFVSHKDGIVFDPGKETTTAQRTNMIKTGARQGSHHMDPQMSSCHQSNWLEWESI